MSGPYAPTTDITDTADTSPRPAPIAAISAEGGWSVPEGLAAETADEVRRPVADELKPTATDALQQDVSPPKWPDGAPPLRPYMRLPFRQRAQFMRDLDPIMAKAQALPRQGDSVGPKEAAGMYDTMAEVQDFLRPLAEDPAAFDAWVDQADDAEFMQLFSAFFAGSQPGEAVSSSS